METFRISDTITGVRHGEPLDSTVIFSSRSRAAVDFTFRLALEEEKGLLTLPLGKADRVFGLGANFGGINKRGRRVESYCTDDPHHMEDKTTLYAAHDFFIVEGEGSHRGYFIDFPGRIRYDLGCTRPDLLSVEIHGRDFEVLEIQGPTVKAVVEDFLALIGPSYVPPKWGFGYFQSRWGYRNQAEVAAVAERFLEEDLPLEGIYLDLDYMEDFKDFTVSEDRFPDFGNFVRAWKDRGVRFIPIIDAGVKVEEGYTVYEEGVRDGHFVQDLEGKPYVAAVWPGKVHFPDFLRRETRAWFGAQYRFLTDLGIEGVWNDMNEPAIFYDEKALASAVEVALSAKGENLGVDRFFHLRDQFASIGNRTEYYQRFTHATEKGPRVNQEVHNLYGHLMTEAAAEGLRRHLGQRYLLISRASRIGMHRVGGIWTGDNSSWWSHLEANVKMMPSINMAGFYYAGADTGGFGGHATGELLTRWLQFSIFTPLLRNHAALGTRSQEPYAFGAKTTEEARHLLRTRYALLPYLYSEFMKTNRQRRLLFTPMALEYPKDAARDVEDQLFFGESLMLAPVLRENQRHRTVELPAPMAEVTLGKDGVSMRVREKGLHRLEYGLEEVKFFLRENTLLPLAVPGRNTKDTSMETLHVLGFVTGRASYDLYDDDGTSFDHESGTGTTLRLWAKGRGKDFATGVDGHHPQVESVTFQLMDANAVEHIKEVKVSDR